MWPWSSNVLGDELQPSWVKAPFIPGHEFFGRVAEVGENVKDYKVGDRIIADQIVPCGECRFCKTGHYWMCQPHNIFGFQNANNGGMAALNMPLIELVLAMKIL